MKEEQAPIATRIYLLEQRVLIASNESSLCEKKRICAEYGCEAVVPLRSTHNTLTCMALEDGLSVTGINECLIRGCDAVLVDLTADLESGDALKIAPELSLASKLGKPILAYSEPIPEENCLLSAFLKISVRRGEAPKEDPTRIQEASRLSGNYRQDRRQLAFTSVLDFPESRLVAHASFEACVRRVAELSRSRQAIL